MGAADQLISYRGTLSGNCRRWRPLRDGEPMTAPPTPPQRSPELPPLARYRSAGTIERELEPGERHLAHAVSIVIPAFNEGAHVAAQVGDVARIMDASGWDYEIIVVDDGSADDTAQRAAEAGAHVLSHPRNRGYGASLKHGIRRAYFDWVLITDADGTYPVAAIPDLLARADANDMVVGARTGETVQVPLVRRPAKAFLRWLASYLSGQHIPDINSGLRLMRKSLVERYEYLLPPGFSFTTTITLASICN